MKKWKSDSEGTSQFRLIEHGQTRMSDPQKQELTWTKRLSHSPKIPAGMRTTLALRHVCVALLRRSDEYDLTAGLMKRSRRPTVDYYSLF